ncbi:alpha/beta hydrolase [Paenibacillus contaminans]|uniref:Alpha/beta hydrolase n=1 Tax=Paenibacillus contaminans TaxID=450362 RepID=A0A329MK83_9BACL|nr:alpha/beta hydrolase [Paenibacillus contaminans]RAV19133.1 alpha/beta hydrolase [Paenibacillus contaminans]
MEQIEAKNKKPSTRLKKTMTIILKSIAVLLIAIVLFMAVVFIVDKISSKSEEGKIHSYGQLVPVDGKKMNVLTQGKGEETVVLLPGYGTAAPALDFKPLVEELSPYYKVVAIEPFGYGLSDETEKERTTENIVSEIHEALQSLKIERYILMGHSITGIYGIDYVNKYPNEVSAFVGIDSSVSTQGGMDVEFPITMFKFLKKSGLVRLALKLGSDPYAGLPHDDETKEQMRMITLKNVYNSSVMNEMENIYPNFVAAQKLTFPKNLPLLLFVQSNNADRPDWLSLHEEQAKESMYGKVVPLEGDHYLHHTRSKEIAENFREYMKEMKKE